MVLGIVIFLRRKRNSSPSEQPIARSSQAPARAWAQRVDDWLLNAARHFDYRYQSQNAMSAHNAVQQHHPPRHSRQHRRRHCGRNALHRTDSGATVKTLPEYKSSLGESEMMLYK